VYSQTRFEIWRQRMHQWASGTLPVAWIRGAEFFDR
jgi:hypothetical protein